MQRTNNITLSSSRMALSHQSTLQTVLGYAIAPTSSPFRIILPAIFFILIGSFSTIGLCQGEYLLPPYRMLGALLEPTLMHHHHHWHFQRLVATTEAIASSVAMDHRFCHLIIATHRCYFYHCSLALLPSTLLSMLPFAKFIG